jgi:hypothetical protein
MQQSDRTGPRLAEICRTTGKSWATTAESIIQPNQSIYLIYLSIELRICLTHLISPHLVSSRLSSPIYLPFTFGNTTVNDLPSVLVMQRATTGLTSGYLALRLVVWRT